MFTHVRGRCCVGSPSIGDSYTSYKYFVGGCNALLLFWQGIWNASWAAVAVQQSHLKVYVVVRVYMPKMGRMTASLFLHDMACTQLREAGHRSGVEIKEHDSPIFNDLYLAPICHMCGAVWFIFFSDAHTRWRWFHVKDLGTPAKRHSGS